MPLGIAQPQDCSDCPLQHSRAAHAQFGPRPRQPRRSVFALPSQTGIGGLASTPKTWRRFAWPWHPAPYARINTVEQCFAMAPCKNEDTGRPKPPGVSRRGKKRRETTRFRRLTLPGKKTRSRQKATSKTLGIAEYPSARRRKSHRPKTVTHRPIIRTKQHLVSTYFSDSSPVDSRRPRERPAMPRLLSARRKSNNFLPDGVVTVLTSFFIAASRDKPGSNKHR